MVTLIKLFAIAFVTWIVAMVTGMFLNLALLSFLPENVAVIVSLVVGLIGGIALLKDSWIDLGMDLGIVKKKTTAVDSPLRESEGEKKSGD